MNSMILMKIEYTIENGKIQANLSKKSDWDLFNHIADLIAQEFNGTLVKKIDGLDQRYWDIEIENILLTLHLEHYLGICLFPDQEIDKANKLVREIGCHLETSIS